MRATVVTAADGDEIFDLTGQMVAVGLESKTIQAAIESLGLAQTCVACYNSPKGQTVSGPGAEVSKLKEALAADIPNLFWREIDTDRVAYHAPYLACFKDYLVKEFTAIVGSEGRPLDGSWLCTSTRDPKEFVLDAHYHARNIVSPVFFQQALETLPPTPSWWRWARPVAAGPSEAHPDGHRAAGPREAAGHVHRGLLPRAGAREEGRVGGRLCLLLCGEAGQEEHARTPGTATFRAALAGPLGPLQGLSCLHLQGLRVPAQHGRRQRRCDGGHYNLVGDHAFLLDHRVNGRALFPATGHLYTMWQAKCKCEKGMKLADFHINSAVVLDPNMAEEVTFYDAEMGNELAVVHDKTVVASATFSFLPESQTARAAVVEAEHGVTPLLQRKQLYMHFKRYGYEYQEQFQLVERRTVPSKGQAGNFGVLRGAAHLIPFMDNFLQLFLEDVRMLQLPTLIREVEMLPGALAEAAAGAVVAIETDSYELTSPNLRMKGLNTMPAAGPQHDALIHDKQVFLPLGEQIREDETTEIAFLATRKYIASAITAYANTSAEVRASLLAERPWMKHVLAHAAKTLGSDTAVPPVDEALYASSLHYRMHVDLYKDLPALLENPFLTLSVHPEHDAFYENNHVMASSAAELAGLVGLVCKEWHGTDLSVWEGGSGSCGFTRRVVPLVERQLEQYVCSDISAIRLGTLEGHPKISSSRHGDNPIELPRGPRAGCTTWRLRTTPSTRRGTSKRRCSSSATPSWMAASSCWRSRSPTRASTCGGSTTSSGKRPGTSAATGCGWPGMSGRR